MAVQQGVRDVSYVAYLVGCERLIGGRGKREGMKGRFSIGGDHLGFSCIGGSLGGYERPV